MSVYRVTEVIGTSPVSWEEAAKHAVSTAARTLRDLRVAEIVQQDLTVSEDGEVEAFRVKMKLSFKFETPWEQAHDRAAREQMSVPAQ